MVPEKGDRREPSIFYMEQSLLKPAGSQLRLKNTVKLNIDGVFFYTNPSFIPSVTAVSPFSSNFNHYSTISLVDYKVNINYSF